MSVRRSRWVLVVLLLAALAVAADQIGARFAAAQLRARVAAATGSNPEVRTASGPFLPQALARRFDTADVSLHSAQLPPSNLEVRDIRAHLRDVPWNSTERIGSVDATAVVPFSTLERRANLPAGSLSGADDGRARVTQKLEVFGLSVAVAATADLRVDGAAVVIEPVGLELAGAQIPLNDDLRARLTEQLRARVPLDGLPAGLRLQDVAVIPEGLRLHLVGQDVPVPQLRPPE